MQVFDLEECDTIQIGHDTEIQIIEIRDEIVRIAIRSESISPYYWEEELACDREGRMSGVLSL